MKMRNRSLTLAVLLFSSFPAAALAQQPPPPPAPPPAGSPPPAPRPAGEADAHFKRGVELYKETDYPAALIEFRRAYEIDPRYQALYNIGETYFQLNDYANALKTLERYLKDGGAQVSAARREEVQKEIDKLRTRVATLDVTTNVPDAEVSIDDISAGKTPLAAPLTVSAGRRKITVSRPGKPPVMQIVEIAGGDNKKIALTLAEDTPEAPPSSPARVAVPWTITGLLAVGAGITGGLALSASSDLKSKLAVYPNASSSDISSAHSKTFALAATTDALIATAVVMAGVSIYLTATSGSRPEAPRTGSVSPRVAWGPLAPPPAGRFLRVEAGPQSARLTGSF